MHEPSLPEAMTSVDLVKELTDNAALLVQRQLAMAKLEAEQELHKRKELYELLGAAGLLAYGGGLFVLMAAACAIGEFAFGHVWMGMLPVAVALFGLALIPYFMSRGKRIVAPPFERTRRELSKELSWAKYHTT